jgi:hypothetical protein
MRDHPLDVILNIIYAMKTIPINKQIYIITHINSDEFRVTIYKDAFMSWHRIKVDSYSYSFR